MGIANKLKNPINTAESKGFTKIAIKLEPKKINGKSEKLNILLSVPSLAFITELHEEFELRLQNLEIILFLKPSFSCTINMLTIRPNIDVVKKARLNKL